MGPDVIVGDGDIRERRPGTAHDLHPDLALLLSTSGSTGSPKLVRLSHDNLRCNAASIADYLGLTPDDRAITSLPMHYCYGLSVVHSHLLVGAGLVLTDLSVVDECFWRLAEDAGATSFAGVPYTFEQLERSGFTERALPSLRYVTQAGGRMAPERVGRWRDHGRRSGWDLVVMYGQTEATARMAWLPPDRADAHPEAVGIPIPGGSFRLEPVDEVDEPGVGELVYAGPNVMQGYAVSAADLARGSGAAPSCAPATWPARSTASGRSSDAAAGREAVRAPDRPRPPREPGRRRGPLRGRRRDPPRLHRPAAHGRPGGERASRPRPDFPAARSA